MKKILLLFIILINTLCIIQAEDSNKEIIKKYYSHLNSKKFQEAYILSNKTIDFETYKSWYIDLNIVDLSDITKINDTEYQVNVVIIENNGKNIYRYDVLFKIENSKIIRSTSKDISHTIINEKIHSYLDNADPFYLNIRKDNTFIYSTNMFEDVGYYYVIGDKITCISTNGSVRKYRVDYEILNDSKIVFMQTGLYDNFIYEDLIFKYYQLLEDKNFQQAYDFFDKSVVFEKYKSWYIDITTIDLSNIQKLNNNSYQLYATFFENNGKDIFMYDVTFTVEKGKIIKTTSKDISDQIMNSTLEDIITDIDIYMYNNKNNQINFYSDNTYVYKSTNFQENGYYYIKDNIIHCISSDNGVKSKFKLKVENNNKNLIIKSLDNDQVIFSTDRGVVNSNFQNDNSKVSIRFGNIPDKATFYLDKRRLNDNSGKRRVKDMDIVRSPGKYKVSVSHADNDGFSTFINVKEGISPQDFIFSYRELKKISNLEVYKKLDKRFNAYHDMYGSEPISILGAVFTNNNFIIENYNEIVSLDKNYEIKSHYNSNYFFYPSFLKANDNFILHIDRQGNMIVTNLSTGERYEIDIETRNITHVELLNELIVIIFKDNTINIYKKDISDALNYRLLDDRESRTFIDNESNMSYNKDNSLFIDNLDINKSFSHFRSKIGKLDLKSEKGIIDQEVWKPIEYFFLSLTYLGKDDSDNIYYSSTIGGHVRVLIFDSNGYTIVHEVFKLTDYSTRPFLDPEGNILFIGYLNNSAVIYKFHRNW